MKKQKGCVIVKHKEGFITNEEKKETLTRAKSVIIKARKLQKEHEKGKKFMRLPNRMDILVDKNETRTPQQVMEDYFKNRNK